MKNKFQVAVQCDRCGKVYWANHFLLANVPVNCHKCGARIIDREENGRVFLRHGTKRIARKTLFGKIYFAEED